MDPKGLYRLRSSYSSTRLAARDVRRPAMGDAIAKQDKALYFESGASRMLRVLGYIKHIE